MDERSIRLWWTVTVCMYGAVSKAEDVVAVEVVGFKEYIYIYLFLSRFSM